jgi:hypothetical protein
MLLLRPFMSWGAEPVQSVTPGCGDVRTIRAVDDGDANSREMTRRWKIGPERMTAVPPMVARAVSRIGFDRVATAAISVSTVSGPPDRLGG